MHTMRNTARWAATLGLTAVAVCGPLTGASVAAPDAAPSSLYAPSALVLTTALHPPGDLPAEAVLGLAGHLDARLPGALPELLDPALDGGLPLGVRGALGEPGRGDAADHGDLLAVDRELGELLEEVLGQTAGEPAAQLLALL